MSHQQKDAPAKPEGRKAAHSAACKSAACTGECAQRPTLAAPQPPEFPRASSRSVLADSSGDDEDAPMDFSVERKMLERARQKDALQPPAAPDRSKSPLDRCEDDEDDDAIVDALAEMDDAPPKPKKADR
ncbi:hypothetical protein M3Y99_01629300 [Aphelenchoides fujianensis]|nr:hypothetical protein M3Y99_01629300 [Aphelenchoides fujianensis]